MQAEYRATTLANPSEVLLDALVGYRSDSGERVSQQKALGITAVFSAVEKISEAVGSLPLKVYRRMDDDEKVEVRGHRSWRMLHDKPNEHTIAHTFWSTVTAQLLLGGNAYIEKDRSDPDGEVDQLWLIDPATVVVEVSSTGRKTFKITQGGKERRYTPEQILHIVGYSLDGVVGCSRIEYCRQTLGIALARGKFEGAFYRQGTRVPGVIEYPGRLGERGLQNLAETFRGLHGGSHNMHKVPVLEEGATFKGVSMSLEDMQFVEGAQLSRSEIAMLFDLPAAYLNASTGDSLTYATQESNQIQFAQMAIAPITNRIARSLSSDPEILPWNVMYASFVLEGLMRGDMKTRAEYWAVMKGLGVVDADYIASRENLPKPPPEPPEPVAAEQPALNGNGPAPPLTARQILTPGGRRTRYYAADADPVPAVTFAEGAITVTNEAPREIKFTHSDGTQTTAELGKGR